MNQNMNQNGFNNNLNMNMNTNSNGNGLNNMMGGFNNNNIQQQGMNMNLNLNLNTNTNNQGTFLNKQDPKSRFSMPVQTPTQNQSQYPYQFQTHQNSFNSNNVQQNFQPQQNNYFQRQSSLNSGMGSNGQSPQQELFDYNQQQQQQMNMGNNYMKDVINTPKQLVLSNGITGKQIGNIYQPTIYQNNNNLPNPVNFQRSQSNKENYGNQGFGMSTNNLNFNQSTNNFNTTQNFNQAKEYIQNFKAKSEEDLQILNQKHEQLINIILAEEEEVITTHRQHIDDMVDLVKQVKNI